MSITFDPMFHALDPFDGVEHVRDLPGRLIEPPGSQMTKRGLKAAAWAVLVA